MLNDKQLVLAILVLAKCGMFNQSPQHGKVSTKTVRAC
jgi:hypothetical protein